LKELQEPQKQELGSRSDQDGVNAAPGSSCPPSSDPDAGSDEEENEKEKQRRELIWHPHDHDILLGRGGNVNKHPGKSWTAAPWNCCWATQGGDCTVGFRNSYIKCTPFFS